MTARIGSYDLAAVCSKKDEKITPVEEKSTKAATLQDRNNHVLGNVIRYSSSQDNAVLIKCSKTLRKIISKEKRNNVENMGFSMFQIQRMEIEKHLELIKQYDNYRLPEQRIVELNGDDANRKKRLDLAELNLLPGQLCKILEEIKIKGVDVLAIKELKLNSNEMSILPNSIGACKNLEVLDLCDNNLTDSLSSFPSSVGQLSKLIKLEIASNKLRRIPVELRKLESLQYLQLSNNTISYVPLFINRWKELKSLDISNNKIKKIAGLNLKKLVVIDVSFNRLKRIPSLLNLEKLGSINCSNNQIIELPELNSLLSKLRRVNVSNNHINILPSDQQALPSLIEFNIDGNGLQDTIVANFSRQIMKH